MGMLTAGGWGVQVVRRGRPYLQTATESLSTASRGPRRSLHELGPRVKSPLRSAYRVWLSVELRPLPTAQPPLHSHAEGLNTAPTGESPQLQPGRANSLKHCNVNIAYLVEGGSFGALAFVSKRIVIDFCLI